MDKRTPETKRSQKTYRKGRRGEGRDVSVTLELKSDADRQMLARLRNRYPAASNSAIAWNGLRALDECEEGVFDFKPRPGRMPKEKDDAGE